MTLWIDKAVKPRKRQPRRRLTAAAIQLRRRKMVEMREKGATLAAIGRRFRLSRERIRQILDK